MDKANRTAPDVKTRRLAESRANLVFINSIDWCYSLKLFPQNSKGTAGKPFTGGTSVEEPFGTVDPKANWKGYVTAVNADDGSVKWKYQSPTPMVAGITTTGDGLVLTADLNGDALAFNAADGKLLWKQNTGARRRRRDNLSGSQQTIRRHSDRHHVDELAD